MAVHSIRGLSLCAGVGGFDLGLRRALGSRYRTVGYVERDAYAASCLVARMEDESLDSAPIWDDLATFDGWPWRGSVDLVAAGFPCQDISTAGRGEGIQPGNRSGLWYEVARVVCEVGPRLVFLENVTAIASRGLGIVLGDLAALGFDAEWDVFSAAGIGAPHLRQRFFLLGFRPLGDSDEPRLEGSILQRRSSDEQPPRNAGGQMVAAADGDAFPPGPADAAGWRTYLRAGGPQPSIRRGADGLSARVDRVRCLGSSIVPTVASRAFRDLARRSEIAEHLGI